MINLRIWKQNVIIVTYNPGCLTLEHPTYIWFSNRQTLQLWEYRQDNPWLSEKEDLLTQLDDVLGYKSTFLHLVLTILSYISYIHMSKFIYITRWGLDKYKLIYTYFKHECMKTLCLVFIPAAEHKLTQITWKKNVINKIYIHARRLTNIKIYFFSTIIQLFLYIPPKCFDTLPAPGISFLLTPHRRSICNDNIT